MKINPNTRIIDITVGDFLEFIKETQGDEKSQKQVENTPLKKHYVYGLSGLAELLGCTTRHASTIKGSGIIDAAIIQYGQKIIIDSELALELLKKNTENKNEPTGRHKKQHKY